MACRPPARECRSRRTWRRRPKRRRPKRRCCWFCIDGRPPHDDARRERRRHRRRQPTARHWGCDATPQPPQRPPPQGDITHLNIGIWGCYWNIPLRTQIIHLQSDSHRQLWVHANTISRSLFASWQWCNHEHFCRHLMYSSSKHRYEGGHLITEMSFNH